MPRLRSIPYYHRQSKPRGEPTRLRHLPSAASCTTSCEAAILPQKRRFTRVLDNKGISNNTEKLDTDGHIKYFSSYLLTFAQKCAIIYNTLLYGGAMVSTGTVRYDKRSGPDNPVKMSTLNNKRQQYCCSCSVSCDAALMPPVP